MRFISVKQEKTTYYGGAQAWFDKTRNQSMGCGIIAAANVILSLTSADTKSYMYDRDEYMILANELSRRYIHVLPKFGINGIFLAIGMNRYFWKNKIKYRASWGTRRKRIWDEAQRMLDENIPVILAIGPIYPFVWKKKKLPLYIKNGSAYVVSTYTSAHYVTITEINDDYLTISSWGKKFYVYKKDFMLYVRKQSNFLFSNIMIIKRRQVNA